MPGSSCLSAHGLSYYNYYYNLPSNNKRTIYPPGIDKGIEVYCDGLDGGGWTVVQYRARNYATDFDRTWTEYANGFNNGTGYWIGLDNLYKLTNDADYELRIDLEDWCGNKAYAHYSNFKVSSASVRYRLQASNFSGTMRDSLTSSNGRSFSIAGGAYCYSRKRSGGWWYDDSYDCMSTNLNGRLYNRNEIYSGYCSSCYGCRTSMSTKYGVYWEGFGQPSNLIRSTKMRMRLKLTAVNLK